ncbi:MAG: peptidoglycan bridge formation glycyltransferase FemA/FemB family protein [Patescibacteria group bacterium]|jgi:lipid II:glycine glycyltransferase (peptidoglycan interpeptide bridge formation enzyme)|nr:peptidoglycan bridge formation glycyltransferase FemA/FemB family protein [Patescibacteria group bacterium]
MQIVQVGDEFKEHWNNFVATNAADGGLLQSWQWGDFQKSLDNKIIRLGAINGDGQLQASALIIKYELPFEYNYLYCPRGPIINSIELADLDSLFAEIKSIAKEEKSFLLRVDPAWIVGHHQQLVDSGFRKSEYEIQPKCNFIIPLDGSQEEIAAALKQKTRYNIGLAQRKGVKVRMSSEISDIEAFWQLMKQTAKRDGFHPHPKEHYKKMFELLGKDRMLKLFIAEFDNKIVAVNMVSFFGDFATYLHGASADMYRELMAPYLLQWEAILEAKKLGFKFYDFGGVNGKTYHNQKWIGISRFKAGFNERLQPREYIGGFDLVINPAIFAIYKFVKQIRG